MAERNVKGQFLPGTSGNATGRPKQRAQYLDTLKKSLTLEKWQEIVDRAIEDAIKGDRYARDWISGYILGKPFQPIGVEGEIAIMTLEMWKQRAAERAEDLDDD